ncbi:MAG TPA: AsmA family protein [Reyranella sp.]|jgi:AsmA protein|nr:AsmA family protein [Reyranella sp.]
MRALKIAGAAIAAVIVVVAVLLFVGIPSGFLTSAIQDRVERETGYRLTIAGSTRIGLWPSLNVKLHDITLETTKDRDTSNRVTVGGIEADMTLASVWSGHPKITELVITRPVLYHPLLRERERAPANRAPRPATTSTGDADANALAIDRVTIVDGTVVMSNVRDRVENRIEGINAEALIGADRKIKLTGSAKASDQPLKFEIKATAPTPPLERQNIPVEFMIASGLLQGPVAGRAEVRLNGSIIMVNGLTGTLGDGAFNGWASFDLASKPLVKVDLDFQRLGVAMSQAPTTSGALASAPWSNASIDLNGLNYLDAQIRISAAELNIGEARFAPVAIDTAIAAGMLRTTFSNLGVYGGQGSGEIMIDASAGSPTFSLNSDLVGVRALPLLRSMADFDKLDGKMQAKMTLHSAGNSQRAILSNLGGTVFAVFQDGAIRGLNVAAMVRSLTSGTLSGWQEGKEQTTDLTQLSASFRVEKGQATTTDLNLVGPLVKMTGAGTIDVAAKAIAFRVEPKVVMTTEGQGRASDPVGLGIPVVIDGPWAQPRIYPDMAGILDNPDAAYAKLKEMGKGLFGGSGGLGGVLGGLTGGVGGNASGSSGSSSGGGLTDRLGETLGNFLQQGIGQRRSQSRTLVPPAAPTPDIPPVQAQSDPTPEAPQDSQAMNEVLRQLFNR